MKWTKSLERQRLPISDIAEPLITVTDIKHYFYCPRIIYFEHVLHAEPILGSQQECSKKKHEEYNLKENRRKDAIYYSPRLLGARKTFFVSLSSTKLGLKGTVDMIIQTANHEYIPVDFKNMTSNKGRAWTDHKYQLTAYALLIEENFDTHVKHGFINYLPEKLILKLKITPTMKTHVKRVLSHIRRIIKEEKLPQVRVAKQKCTGGCGFKYLCQI